MVRVNTGRSGVLLVAELRPLNTFYRLKMLILLVDGEESLGGLESTKWGNEAEDNMYSFSWIVWSKLLLSASAKAGN